MSAFVKKNVLHAPSKLVFKKRNTISQVKVITKDGDYYHIGQSSVFWRSRFHKNSHSFTCGRKSNSTNLSKCIADLEYRNIIYGLDWSIISYAALYNIGNFTCDLCREEMYYITTSKLILLNLNGKFTMKYCSKFQNSFKYWNSYLSYVIGLY